MSREDKRPNTLINLIDETRIIMREIIENDGDLPEDLIEQIVQIDLARKEKIDSYAHLIDRLKLEAGFWKSKAEFYNTVSKSCNRAVERMKSTIKEGAIRLDKSNLEGLDFRFKVSKRAPKLVIKDPSLVPSQYLMRVVKEEPDKDLIKADLIQGKSVDGTLLEDVYAVSTYSNRSTK